MKPFIQITRHLDDVEPHALRLVIIASNGLTTGCLDFYLNAGDLKKAGNALTEFSYEKTSDYLLEVGSERKEDNFSHYFRFKAFPTGKGYRSYAIELRLNNNQNLREYGWSYLHQECNFSIETDIDNLRELGSLLNDFSKLKQDRLYWTPETGYLDTALGQTSQNYGDAMTEAFKALPK